ncbi:cystine ABC transporter [Klebsiella pneumoniae]|uniref:L-cystine transport system permease protein TcyL n=1 Tax=Klebsiella pneumoniae TaxID=573 RepID=A0A2X3EPE0_KLEPN|nr:cystine ABC transporter [Klebsiella pneumoniae]
MQESIQLVIDSAPFLLKGAVFTLQLSIGGMFFGLVLGFILALMRMSPVWPVKWLARMYISIFRGTPLIAQLFMIYYGLPQFGIELDPIPAAMIGLSLNTAAYAAETLRAAIASIDKGQWEAAASIGMTPWQTMRRAILPQAARVALPPLSNSFISLVKDTSLAGNDPGAGAVPSGAANHLANPGGLHYVSGGFPDLLGNGDSALLAAELF